MYCDLASVEEVEEDKDEASSSVKNAKKPDVTSQPTPRLVVTGKGLALKVPKSFYGSSTSRGDISPRPMRTGRRTSGSRSSPSELERQGCRSEGSHSLPRLHYTSVSVSSLSSKPKSKSNHHWRDIRRRSVTGDFLPAFPHNTGAAGEHSLPGEHPWNNFRYSRRGSLPDNVKSRMKKAEVVKEAAGWMSRKAEDLNDPWMMVHTATHSRRQGGESVEQSDVTGCLLGERELSETSSEDSRTSVHSVHSAGCVDTLHRQLETKCSLAEVCSEVTSRSLGGSTPLEDLDPWQVVHRAMNSKGYL